MSDCLIEFRKDGEKLDLKVFPPEGGEGERFIRQLPDLAASDLDELRLGQPTDEVVDRVTAKVSEWLLNPNPNTHKAELDLAKILGLAQAAGGSSRLLFSARDIDDPALRSQLFDIPMELLVQEKNGEPFITNNRVAAMIHLLPKAIQPPTSSKAGALPFKVLVVRSNPDDLGKAVPEAAELQKHILEQRPDLKDNLVVDVLSSENGFQAAGRPTREQFVKQLEQPYDVLVYLGHGDVRQPDAGALPIGALLLENEDGTAHDSFDAKRLSSLLHTRPVPVVLLVGCLTAAELPQGVQISDLKSDIPRWMRGSQGVAQALINGQSGVQLVVGMRYRVERNDALVFLKRFFKSLLTDTKLVGNVEAAVRSARVDLRVLGKQHISWAAPTIFRMLGEEPMFSFLASQRTLEPSPKTQELRSLVWESLKSLSSNQAGASPLQPDLLNMLDRIEHGMIAELGGAAAILTPDLVRVPPDQLKPAPEKTTVVVPFRLDRPLSVSRLQGVVVESSGSASISEVRASAALEQAGFELLTGAPGGGTIRFRVEANPGGVKEIPAGVLFEVVLAIGASIQTVYTLGPGTVTSDPAHPLGVAQGAVIVQSP